MRSEGRERVTGRVVIALTLALAAFGCGGKSSKNDAGGESGGANAAGGSYGGSLSASGSVGAAAQTSGGRSSGGRSSGGVTSGGNMAGGTANAGATNAGAASGGRAAGGAAASGGLPSNDAGAPCLSRDGSISLDLRACSSDSDCALRILPSCCGTKRAAGLANDVVCSATPPNCAAVDCAEGRGFITDDGQQTLDMAEIRVRCRPGEPGAGACASSLANSDVVTCGAAVCDAGELCVHLSSRGGPAPRCLPIPADGACPADTEYVMECDGRAPGCRELLLTPEPHCSPIPPGCGAPTACACLPSELCGGQSCRAVMGHQVDCFDDSP